MAQTKKTIQLYVNTNQLITAAIDRIVVEVLNKKDKSAKSQTLLFTGCSPLAGTTSTSIGMAIAVAETKRKTLLIDCDVRKSVQYKKLNQEISVGLADYLLQDENDGKIMPDHIIYQTNIDNLHYIPCGICLESSTRILCSAQMEQLIDALKDYYDCIILDFPSLAIVPDAQIMFQKTDGIILMAALGETRKRQVKDAKRKIAPFAGKYYGMIVNKIPRDMYKRDVRDYDYYFIDKKGEQKLSKNISRKKMANNMQSLGGK